MRYLPLLAGALLLAVPAHADNFWLTNPKEQARAAEGSSPQVIRGVLLGTEDGHYRIRVEGGVVRLPTAAVFQIDKDNLDVDAVVAAEATARAENDRAYKLREKRRQTAGAARERGFAEASARRSARTVEAAAPARGGEAERSDPVLGVATGADQQLEMMREAERHYERNRDRRYLKQLRQLRRMR